MADEHDDLLNFEVGEDYADGTLNEDELLLSDEEHIDDDKEPPAKKQALQNPPSPSPSPPQPSQSIIDENPEPEEEEKVEEKIDQLEIEEKKGIEEEEEEEEVDDNVVELQHKDEEFSDIQSEQSEESNQSERPKQPQQSQPPQPQQQHQQQFRPQFRPQKFQPRGMPPRWMGPGRPPMMMGQRMPPNMRGPGPFPPQRGPFFMQPPRPGHNGPPLRPQRFFYPNVPPQPVPAPVGYVPTPINHQQPSAAPPVMPRKVLINPNFKGGVEAVKSQLLKDFSSSSSSAMSEDELLRKQQEFINRNMRSIEKRRHERSPSPNYRRSYSHSPSPPRFNQRRRPPFKRYERRRSVDGSGKPKDENLPEEDEETRAYREKIETQRKQREELIKQKEMRRRKQMEAKAKETEPLKPIVVTEKKLILSKKARLDEKSTTPPIDDAPIPASLTTGRKILIKPKDEIKIGIAGSEKRKLQKIIRAEN